MGRDTTITTRSLAYIAAPTVNQSDLAFRILVQHHGATLAYTQMLDPARLLDDQEYRELHMCDISEYADDESGVACLVVVQLCGNDLDVIVCGGRIVQGRCDATTDSQMLVRPREANSKNQKLEKFKKIKTVSISSVHIECCTLKYTLSEWELLSIQQEGWIRFPKEQRSDQA